MREAKGATLVALSPVEGGTDDMIHLTEEQLSSYTNRTLSAAELLWVDDHLNECAACQENLSSVLQAWGGDKAVNSTAWELAADWGEDHLNFTQLAAYVDQQLDEVEQEIVLSHLQVCTVCQEEIEDLRSFKQTLSTPNLAYSIVATASDVAPFPRWENILSALRATRWWAIPAISAASLALLALWFLGRQTPAPIVVQDTAPSTTPSVAATLAPINSTSPTPKPSAVSPASSAEEQIVQTALTKGRLEIPLAAKTLRGRSGNLMGDKSNESAFAILAPQGVMIESDHPVLQWTPLADAKQYVVTITDQQDNIIAQSPALTATQWTVATKLQRGQTYLWQVVATAANGKDFSTPPPSAPEASFMILSTDAFTTVARARVHYVDSPLALGIIYARVGLLAQAELELRRAGQQPIANRLLNDLQRQLREP